MKKPLLLVKDYSIRYNNSEKEAVKGFNLEMHSHQTVGIIGETGSGKSSIAHGIMGLLNKKAFCSGKIIIDGITMDLDRERSWDDFRWSRLALVFQNSMNVLNPMMKIRKQIEEPMFKHLKLSKREIRLKSKQVLESVGLEPLWWEAYPHQLSGGMRQKVLIAMALSCSPSLLIVDEPTMSLDPEAKKQIMKLLKDMQREYGFGMIVISHEMHIVKSLCDEIHVMYDGWQIEKGSKEDVLYSTLHPYTKGLINASWELDSHRDIWGIPEHIQGRCPRCTDHSGCPFYERCFQATPECQSYMPAKMELGQGHDVRCCRNGIALLLKASNLSKAYRVGKQNNYALKSVSCEVYEGEILAVMGRSGSGKSTLAHVLSGFESKDSGNIVFQGENDNSLKWTRKENGIQLIVQDPSVAVNHLWSVRNVLEEPLESNLCLSKEEQNARIAQGLKMVQLPRTQEFLNREMGELSGGQKQRIMIARALVMRPKLLIADEISAMLDPSNAANLVWTLRKIQRRTGMSCIYITHDIHLARKISDRVLIMEKGEKVQEGHGGKLLDKRIEALTSSINIELYDEVCM